MSAIAKAIGPRNGTRTATRTTRALRKDIDERAMVVTGIPLVGAPSPFDVASIAADALEEQKLDEAALADILAQAAPVVLDGTSYRVIHAEVRPSLAALTNGVGMGAADHARPVTIAQLLGPRGGVSILMINIRHAAADRIPLAYHLKTRRWYRVTDNRYERLP